MSDVDRESLKAKVFEYSVLDMEDAAIVADALLPLLTQVKATARAEGAAEVLLVAADEVDRNTAVATDLDVTRWLRDRARSMSAPTEDAL